MVSFKYGDSHNLGKKIEQNDPSITSLTVDFDETEGDDWRNSAWERRGLSVGENTNIKKLDIYVARNDGQGSINFHSFCKGLALNRSIESLSLRCMQLGYDDYKCGIEVPAIESLSPFFWYNTNLTAIDIYIEHMSPEAAMALAAALRECKESSLEEIKLTISMSDHVAGNLIGSLYGHQNITMLNLSHCSIGPEGTNALAALLQNPKSKLQYLDIRKNVCIDDECANMLTEAL